LLANSGNQNVFSLRQVKELQKQTGVRIKVLPSDENTENKEAVILIEESFASGQVSNCIVTVIMHALTFTLTFSHLICSPYLGFQ